MAGVVLASGLAFGGKYARFTEFSGSKVKLTLASYPSTALVTLDLLHTIFETPTVPKARVAAVMVAK
ncbi:hypothetical protein QF001_000399 [Paraburkholderia youngii]